MTKDEIVEMAVQAGIAKIIAEINIDIMEAFAKLVEERTAAKERRDCAKACAELGEWACVHAIEARGEAK